MLQSKPSLVQTSNFGGSQGSPFNDAQAISKWPSELTIDPARSIAKIEVRAGWVVDSITTTYRLIDQSTQTIKHGSDPSAGTVVELNPDEILDSIYGFAGYYPYYKESLVITIGFTIFNTATSTTRIAGPFGGNNGHADGQVYHISGPIALAGFETNGSQIGISGLSILKSTVNE